MSEAPEKVKLKINKKKTKPIVIGKKKNNAKLVIKLVNLILEHFTNFCYLVRTVACQNRYKTKFRRKIALAKQAFHNKKNLLTNNDSSMEESKMFAKTFLWMS